MFLVSDTLEKRQKYIIRQLQYDPVIAVLLSAADFEWTVRRAIIAMGSSPNVEIRDNVLGKRGGLKTYQEAWEKEVKIRFGKSLKTLIPGWKFFNEQAYPLRHKLIHGVQGTTGKKFAEDRVQSILSASKAITDFAKLNGIDLYSKLPVRRRAAK